MKTITKMVCISSNGWNRLLTQGKVYDIVSGEVDSFGTKRATYFESDDGNYYMLETQSMLEKTFTPLQEVREQKLKELGI